MTSATNQVTTEAEPVGTEARPATTKRRRKSRLPRTTGVGSGIFIVILGVWGGLVPFVGGYFHYAFGSYSTWQYTHDKLWLSIIPGAVAVLGGLLLLRSARRTGGVFASWIALAAGAWFAVGPAVSLLWHPSGDPIGAPMGGHIRQMLEQVGFFYGLGVAIAALAAFAMGRFVSRPVLEDESEVPPIRRRWAPAVPGRTAEPRRFTDDEPRRFAGDEPRRFAGDEPRRSVEEDAEELE